MKSWLKLLFFGAFLLFAELFCTTLQAQTLIPKDKTAIYRRSFTASYDLIGSGPVREAMLSPDSSRVAFVRDNDLYLKELSTGVETRITCDGEPGSIINGATDWVYEEEFAFTRAYEFSPDNQYIAFLRFDESRVPEFSMTRYDGRLYPEVQTFKYPKAGEENSIVTLHLYDIAQGTVSKIDTGTEMVLEAGTEDEEWWVIDQYIPRIGWTPDGELFFYRLNRLQNKFEVVLSSGSRGGNGHGGGGNGHSGGGNGHGGGGNGHGGNTMRVIYEETSSTYVERPDHETVTFLDGDRFVVRSEAPTGWWSSYIYSIEHGLIGAAPSEGDEHPDDIELFLQYPPDDGREFFSFAIADGTTLYGWILKPEGFDPAKRYPVFMTQYSGPGSMSVFVPTIKAGDREIYDPLLDAGYIVACVDPRGTGGRGEAFKKQTYRQLGRLETEDQIAAAHHLASLPYVDPARIGIYGWSYGGFVALNSILKGADIFKAAVAVAPVTSWRFYDTIYTEIYNGLPWDNPAGYDDNSPLNHAGLLRGKLLLIHGSGDDNVHVTNTMEMARALIAADKEFDMMIYPDDNHSMRPSGSRHIRRKIVDWVVRNL